MDKLGRQAQKKLNKWNRMLAGDKRALLEIMVERGMAKRSDFEELKESHRPNQNRKRGEG